MLSFSARLIVLYICTLAAQSYKILVILPTRASSHAKIFLPLTEALATRGHQVTVLSHFSLQSPPPNYKNIQLQTQNSTRKPRPSIELTSYTGTSIERWAGIYVLHNMGRVICQEEFTSLGVKSLLQSDTTFDLIIVFHLSSDCFFSLANKFKAPIVVMAVSILPEWSNEIFANPTNPSYIPNAHSEYSNLIPFFGRLENFILGVRQQLYYTYILIKEGEDVAKKYFGEQMLPFRDISLNASVLLMPTHFSLTLPRPLVPPVIEIGRVHIRMVRALPSNLEKWINESTHGVIYFSLGSMIKGHTFPDEKRQEFLKAFARLPQRVLWKWENETMPGKPDNVMIQKWMPQLDILCHPNVKAFISHGGLLGTTEAVHCGVPAMVMPQYGDQFTNAKALEANGGGVILHLYEATEEKVYNALKTILDPNFKKQAEELSARFRDRPMPPLETAIYWVEYVARHRGAHHMRTAAVGMPLYKYLLLDVIAFLLLVFGLVFAVLFYITRAIFRKLFGRKDKQKSD